jgi:hypothetical protein
MSDEAQLQEACRIALEVIAPCVVGWNGNGPVWAKTLATAVHPLQDALGIERSDLDV